MTVRPPKRSPTMQDVAARAGVSPSTVSLVLSGRRGGESRISEETRRRIHDAVRELHYVPSQTARHLRRQKTERVCVVLPSVGLPFDALLVQALKEAAVQHGYSVIVSVGGSAAQIAQVLTQVRAGLADGLVLSLGFEHAGQTFEEPLERLATAGTPVVVLSNHHPAIHYDVVTNTEASSTYEAVRYLLRLGHTRVGFIGHTLEHPQVYLRHGSYLKALADHGLEVLPQLTRLGAGDRHEAYSGAQDLLALEDRPTALLCGSDTAAVSALAAAHAAGLRVPEDLAVIGTGNIPEGEFSHPPLTTVGPLERDFSAVATLLFDRLLAHTIPPPRRLEQPWGLIRRRSA